MGYRGKVNMTRTGILCQKWDTNSPHTHDKKSAAYPNAGIEGNECRNPDTEPQGPWCYTSSPSTRWDYCAVEMCPGGMYHIVNLNAILNANLKTRAFFISIYNI